MKEAGKKMRRLTNPELRARMAEPATLTIALARESIMATIAAWRTYRFRHDFAEQRFRPVMVEAVKRLMVLMREFPIAPFVPVATTANGWAMLIEFCLRAGVPLVEERGGSVHGLVAEWVFRDDRELKIVSQSNEAPK
jgi:hypothetical protein